MRLFDGIALKAKADGETAAFYYSHAHQHAKAFWIYIVIAGMVWYFFGWHWALLPALLGLYVALKSLSCSLIAIRLIEFEKGQD